MEKFNKIIADGREFEPFATPSDLVERVSELRTALTELQGAIQSAVSDSEGAIRLNDNNNREMLQEVIGGDITDAKDNIINDFEEKIGSVSGAIALIIPKLASIEATVGEVNPHTDAKVEDLKIWAEVAIVESLSNKVQELLDITNGKVDNIQTLLASDTNLILSKLQDLNILLGGKVDAVKTDTEQINAKLDDALVGKDAVREAITTKLGRQASPTLIGMAQDVMDIPSADLNWSSIGMTHSPQSLKDAIEYSKGIKDAWEQGAQDKTKFVHTGDTDLWIMPNVDLLGNNTTKLSLQNCSNLRVISEELDTSTVTDWSHAFYGTALQSIPQLDWGEATIMTSTFYGLPLSTLPNINSMRVTDFNSTFRACTRLNRIESIDFTAMTFGGGITFQNCNELRYMVIRNLGNSLNSNDLSFATVWGTGSEGNKESLRKTLVELTPTKTVATTVKLSPNTYAVYETFSEEDKQIIEDKGFTITK